MVDWRAMQAMQTILGSGKDAKKVRLPVSDCNIKQMSMGSWHASLSHEGRSIHALGAKSRMTGMAGTATAKVKK